MPINNSYNQTPKRIFTNKPFIKGMNYTNADLEPFVCRAVANLELESSNSATKLRKGITNNILNSDKGLVYKFYKKYVIFTKLITEDLYNANMESTLNLTTDRGLKILNEDGKENDIYDYIITNNTELEYTTELTHSKDELCSLSGCEIIALVSNEGKVNHVINNSDYSFMFLGIIKQNNTQIYKGPIKLYYHVTAQKIIIEAIRPQTLDIVDVNTTGINIIASNPAIYKDWINYQNGPQYYSDYFGDTRAITEEDKNKAIIDITTVALYDAPVEPVPYNNSSNANMLVSIDKTKQDPFYIRPFYAIPNKEYGVMVTAQSKNKLDYVYNFISGAFERTPRTEVNRSNTEIKNMDIIIPEIFINPRLTFNDINDESTVTIKADSAPTLFRLAASNENIDVTTITDSNLLSGVITDPNVNFEYRLVKSYIYNMDALSEIYSGNISAVTGYNHSHSVNSTSYLYRKSYIPNNKTLCTYTFNDPVAKYDGVDFFFRVDGNSTYIVLSVPLKNDTFTINFPFSSKEYIDDHIYNTGNNIKIRDIKLTVVFAEGYHDMSWRKNIDVSVTSQYSSTYNNGIYTGTVSTYANANEYLLDDSGADIESFFEMAASYTDSSASTYSVKFYRSFSDYTTYLVDKRWITLTSNDIGNEYVLRTSALMITDYTKVAQSNQTTTSTLYQQFNINYANNTLDITSELTDNTTFINTSIKTPIAEKLNNYTSSQLSTILNDYSILTATLASSNNTATQYPITVMANLKYYQINKSNCHYITNNGYSIPIVRNIDSNIDTSTFKVVLFPYEEFDESSVYYKPDEFIEKTLYSFGTDGEKIVNYVEYKSNPLFSKSLNMTNHLGHTVVWGDYTDSNSLYYSAFNDISYFPSNYIFTFDNPIVYAYPHRDSLVVFTTDDVYMLHSGNVPSTTATDGSEVAFTQSLIQANTRLGKQNIDTVRAIGKDLFFINNNNQGYLLKSNKYVADVSDVYVIKLTNQIDDLLDNPYQYAKERYMKWYPDVSELTVLNKLSIISTFSTTDSYQGQSTISIDDDYEVIDGDTIKIGDQSYRLIYIDTPEITTNERLANTAKFVLSKLMAQSSTKILYYSLDDTDNAITDNYGRILARLVCDDIDVSAIMLYNGLAEYYDSKYTGAPDTIYTKCYSSAKINKRGIHNNNVYQELTIDDTVTFVPLLDNNLLKYNPVWNTNSNELYCYTTNSYVYIIQAIKLDIQKAITIFYKYSIDAKVWTTYDIPVYIKPNDIIPDNNTVGFKILCNNDNIGPASILEFKNNPQDIIQYKFTKSNDLGEYTLDADLKSKYINVYFDSGNQSLALMNDKLFREIKLLLGSLPNSLLDMDYSIDFYTDGKLVIPNQKADCDTHIHHRPINTHYKGTMENVEGFQKITFFAPARGRIPRIVFSLTCESDINILEYAIVYMQLNAK